MKKMKKIIHKMFSQKIQVEKDGGYALITALIFFLTASTAIIAGISDAVFRETRIVRNEYVSKQSYFIAEAGAEDISYRMKENKLYDLVETYSIGDGVTTVTTGYNDEFQTEVKSVADIGGTKRVVELTLDYGSSISFPYALQVGLGGIDLSGGASIVGDVYTTGSVRGCSSCEITGNVVAAGKSTSVLNQDNSTPIPSTYSITFGNANGTQDFGQSFVVSESGLSLTDLEIYIKKIGSPANATVRIVNDNSGKPTGSTLASGTLSSSLVGTSYGWYDVVLTANPVLTSGTTYWILIDGSTDSSDYYQVGANTAYGNGLAKVGRNSSWNSIPDPGGSGASLDGYFKVSLGTNEEGITGESQWNKIPVTSAYSYKATYVDADDDLYCQIGLDNNKACDTSRGDPSVETSPIADSAIVNWKEQVESNDNVYEGNYTPGNNSYLYGLKVEGDLIIDNGRTVNVGGIIWVTGSIIVQGGSNLKSSGYDEGVVVIADGNISVSGGSQVSSSDYGSPVVLVTTSDSEEAVTISGGSNGLVVYAPYGGVSISGGGELKAVVANYISAEGGSEVIYEPSVSQLDVFLDGGEVVPFGIRSWKESQ